MFYARTIKSMKQTKYIHLEEYFNTRNIELTFRPNINHFVPQFDRSITRRDTRESRILRALVFIVTVCCP